MNNIEYIVSIVLKGRDELTAVLAKAQAELVAFQDGVAAGDKRSAQERAQSARALANKWIEEDKRMSVAHEQEEKRRTTVTTEEERRRTAESKAAADIASAGAKAQARDWEHASRIKRAASVDVEKARLKQEATDAAAHKREMDRVKMRSQSEAQLAAQIQKLSRERVRTTTSAEARAIEERLRNVTNVLKDRGDKGAEDFMRRSLRTATNELNNTERSAFKVGRRLAEARAEAQKFARQFASAKSSQEADALQHKLAQVAVKLRQLGDDSPIRRVADAMREARADAEKLTRESDRTGRTLRRVGNDANHSSNLMRRWAQSVDNASLHTSALASNLRGLLILAVITFAQQLIGVLLALGGQLISLASAATMAGAALGGALVAGVAQAIPVIGLLAAAIHRVTQTMQAVTQENLVDQQQQTKAGQAKKMHAGAANTLANAQDGLISAYQGVAQAQQQLLLAQEALTVARRDASRQLTDLIFAEKEAKLAAEGSALSEVDAQDRLRAALSSGNVTDLARDKLDLRGAHLSVAEAADRERRAHEDANRELGKGVEGSDQVRAAKRGIEDAKRSLVDAQRSVVAAKRGIDAARESASKAAGDNLASAGKLNYMLANLDGAEKRLYGNIRKLQRDYKEAFRPITDNIVEAFSRTINRVDKLLGDKKLLKSFDGLSKEMATSVDQITASFTDDKTMKQFRGLIDEAAGNMPNITRAFDSIGHILMNIAQAAAPVLHDLIRDFADWVGEKEAKTQNIDRLTLWFRKAETYLYSMLHLTSGIIDLFTALVGVSAPAGQKSVENMAAGMHHWADQLRDNSGKAKKFFEDARKSAGYVWDVIKAIGSAMMDAWRPDSVKEFSQFLTQTLLPALTNIIRGFGSITHFLFQIANSTVIGPMIKLGIEFLAIAKIFRTISALAFAGKVLLLGREASATQPAMKGLIGTVTGIGGAFTGALAKTRAWATGTVLATEEVRAATAAVHPPIVGGARGMAPPIAGTAVGGIPAPMAPPVPGTQGRPASRMAGVRRVASGAGRLAGGVGGFMVLGGVIGAATGDNRNVGDVGQNFASGATLGLLPSAADTHAEDRKKSQAFLADVTSKMERLAQAGKTGQVEKMMKSVGDFKNIKFGGSGSLIEGMDKFLAKYPKVRRAFQDLGEFGKRDIKIGLKDLIDPQAAENFANNLRIMADRGANSIKGLRGRIQDNFGYIDKAFTQGSKSWIDAMIGNFKGGIAGVKLLLKNHVINNEEAQKEIVRITKKQMKFMRDNMADLSSQGKEAMAANMTNGIDAVAKQMSRGGRITRDGMKLIDRMLRTQLSALGLSDEDINASIQAKKNANLGHADSHIQGTHAAGFIGMPGERGPDNSLRVLGRGEFVGNYAHRAYIEPALYEKYGHGLPEMYDRVHAEHGAPYKGIGMASGGMYGGVTPAIADLITRLDRRGFHHGSTTGPGHAPGGFHPRGMAVDFGDATNNMRALWRIIFPERKKFAEMFGPNYLNPKPTLMHFGAGFSNSDLQAQHNNHIHLAIASGAAGRLIAGMNVAGSALMATVKHIKQSDLKNPLHGEVGLLAGNTLDVARRQANKFMDQHAADSMINAGAGGPIFNVKGGSVADILAKVWAKTGLPFKALLSAIETGIVESGLRNLSGGDASSVGWRQELSTYGSMAERMNVSHGASRFFNEWRQFADPGESAGQIAAQVQRPAAQFRGRYSQVEQAALRVIRRLGIRVPRGFALGGEISGIAGQAKAIIAHAGEWILNEDHQKLLADLLGIPVDSLRSVVGFKRTASSTKHGSQPTGRTAYVGDSLGVGTLPYIRRSVRGAIDANVVGGRSSANGLAALRELLRGHDYKRILFDLGTNDATAAQLKHSLRVADRISGSTDIFTSLVHGPHAAAKNAVLRRYAASHDDIHLLDPGRQGIGPDGIHYSPSGYRRRAEIFASAFKKPGTAADKATSDYQLPAFMPESLHGIREEWQKVGQSFRKLDKTKAPLKRWLAVMQNITKDGGLLDAAIAAYDKFVSGMELSLKRATFRITRSGMVVKHLDDLQISTRELHNLERAYDALMGRSGRIRHALHDLAEKLKNTDLKDSERQNLQVQQRNLKNRLRDVNTQIADNIQSRFDAQQAQIDAAIKWATEGAERHLAKNDLKTRVATALGQTEKVGRLSQDRIKTINDEIAALQYIQPKSGPGRQQIADRIAELQTTVQEIAIQSFHDAVDQVNNAAARRQTAIGLLDRVADIQQRVGDATGAAIAHGRNLQATGANLTDQRNALQNMYALAVWMGDTGAQQSITDQIAELNVQIEENTQAVKDNVTAIRQTHIDFISGRQSFQGGAQGGVLGIIQAVGQITGADTSEEQKANIAKQRLTLGSTGAEYRTILRDVFGVSVDNLHGIDFARAITGMNFDQIESGMSEADKAQFENLINAIIENESALQQNTQAMQDLSQTVDQSWSSTAWQWYRNAIFTGSGGLLPQYKVPGMDSGGIIQKDGFIYGHAQEGIVPAQIMRSGFNGGDTMKAEVNVVEQVQKADPTSIAQEMMWAWKTRSR